MLFDLIQDCFFQAWAVCEMKEVEMIMESEVISKFLAGETEKYQW